MSKLKQAGGVLALAGLLAGCEPSADDIRDATNRNQQIQLMLGLVAGSNPRARQNPEAPASMRKARQDTFAISVGASGKRTGACNTELRSRAVCSSPETGGKSIS